MLGCCGRGECLMRQLTGRDHDWSPYLLFYFTNCSIFNLRLYVCHFFSIVHISDIVTYGREGVSEWLCIIGHVDRIGVLLAFYS